MISRVLVILKQRISMVLVTVPLAACTILPGQYEVTQKWTPSSELPELKSYAITPTLIRELDLQEKEKKDQISKDQLLMEKMLANTVTCTTGSGLEPKTLSSGSQRGSKSNGCDPTAIKAGLAYEYKLGIGDVLRINVWNNPDFNLFGTAGTAGVGATIANAPPAQGAGRVIEENGRLYFPLIGDQQAAGMTIKEFRQRVIRQLSAYIKDPQVDVSVLSYRSQRVFLNGEVRAPGVYPITDIPQRISDLVGIAGGTTIEADMNNVTLIRDKKTYSLDLYDFYYEGRTGENILLKAGDVVNVADRQSRKVFVMGEVLKPGSQVMRRGKVSLTEAIMDAGGVNQFSVAAGRVYVLRADENGAPLLYQLDASQPEAMVLGSQFILKPRDYVFVNPTDLTVIGRTVAQLLQGLGVTAQTRNLGVFY